MQYLRIRSIIGITTSAGGGEISARLSAKDHWSLSSLRKKHEMT